MWTFQFFFSSILLGFGLSMDTFSISLANGLKQPLLNRKRCVLISSIFAFCQGAMPLIGWICIHNILHYFTSFQKFIPWIALLLLTFIGSKMIYESIKDKGETVESKPLGIGNILLQAVATSIDALSVGFTIGKYVLIQALVCTIIIMIITFALCFTGIQVGKKFGTALSNKAGIIGGIILIFIGVEIFITGLI